MKKVALIVFAALTAAPAAFALDLEIPKGVGQPASPKGSVEVAPPASAEKDQKVEPPASAATAPVTPPATSETPPKGDFALTPPADATTTKPKVDFSKFAEADYVVQGAWCDPVTGGLGTGGQTVRLLTTNEILCKPD